MTARWLFLALPALGLAELTCAPEQPALQQQRRAASAGDGLVDLLSDLALDGGGCGVLPVEGCCDGETLWWCDGATQTPQSLGCARRLHCGWSSSQRYDCNTSGASDPTGVHPRACDLLAADGPHWRPTPTDAAVSDGVAGSCRGITMEGCCLGNLLQYCDGGVLHGLDCRLNPKCGWLANAQYYDCGTAGGDDPSGTRPKACPGPAPDAKLDGPSDTGGSEGPRDGERDRPGEPVPLPTGCTCRAGGEPGAGAPFGLALAALSLGCCLRRRRAQRDR